MSGVTWTTEVEIDPILPSKDIDLDYCLLKATINNMGITKAIELAKGKVSGVENWASCDGGRGAWLIQYNGQKYFFDKSNTPLMQAMAILRRTIAGQALAEMGYSEDEILKIANDPLLVEEGTIHSLVSRVLTFLKTQ